MKSLPYRLQSLTIVAISFAITPALSHPTNGHMCTEFNEAARCFDSDGFCQWAFGQCLYRCDIHDSREDCEQIKEGCIWQSDACEETSPNLDAARSLAADSMDATSPVPRLAETEDRSVPDARLQGALFKQHTTSTDEDIDRRVQLHCKQSSSRFDVQLWFWVLLAFWRQNQC